MGLAQLVLPGASSRLRARRLPPPKRDALRAGLVTCSTLTGNRGRFANRRWVVRGAVLHTIDDKKLDLRDDVQTVGPDPGEVLIKLRAAGVCHSDLSARNGGLPQSMPTILGHEAAGVVEAVGDGVTNVAPGDHVIASWLPPCGSCAACRRGQPHLCFTHVLTAYTKPRFLVGDTPVFGMVGCGAFAEQMVIPSDGAVKIADDVPFEVAAL